MKNDRFNLGKSSVPCGKRGKWTIAEFEVSNHDALALETKWNRRSRW